MKTKLSILLIAVITFAGCVTGCKTTANPSGIVAGIDPVKAGHAAQIAAKNGSLVAIAAAKQKGKDIRPYFLDASLAINAAIATTNITPADLTVILSPLTKDPLVASGVADAVQIYGDFYGDVAAQKLDSLSPYAIPVLQGVALGFKQGYDLTAP